MQHQPENYLLNEVANFVSVDTFVLQCLLALCHFRITALIFQGLLGVNVKSKYLRTQQFLKNNPITAFIYVSENNLP